MSSWHIAFVKLFVAVAILLSSGALLAESAAPGPDGPAFYDGLPLGAGVHGDLIWARAEGGSAVLPSAARSELVLYRTTTPDGRDVAVSGVVSVPKGTPPAGGWPIITWAHGTTGDAMECAPSLDAPSGAEHSYLYVAETLLDDYAAHGYAVVQTDYEGNGTPGVHPYLVGEAEARDTIDIVRAARQLDGSIGTRYVIMGHSQGGHAALFAAARAAAWAPELTALGVVAYAPGSHFSSWLAQLPHEVTPDPDFVFAALLIRGYAATYPSVHPEQLWAQRMARLTAQLDKRCAIDVLLDQEWAAIVPFDAFAQHADLAPLLHAAAQNEPGILEITIPALLVQGTADEFVPPAASDALARELCARGAPLTYDVVPAARHVGVLPASLDAVRAWVNARFAVAPAASNCDRPPKAA